jgi:superfamily II DNA or RNA helicase
MVKIKTTISNYIWPELLPPLVSRRIKKELSIPNPAYEDAVKFKRRVHGISKYIRPYVEENGRLGIPRGYLNRYLQVLAKEGLEADLEWRTTLFEKKELPGLNLREYQKPWVDKMLSEFQGVGQAPPGCHRKGTGILMSDGLIKAVEKIVVGDVVRGEQGPQPVLRLCRGSEAMYKITPTKGSPWYVNKSHVLSLVFSNNPKGRGYKKGQIIDITVSNYLKLPKYIKHSLKLYRTRALFEGEKKKITIDPYFLGVLLGDAGLVRGVAVTASDPEIIKELYLQAANHGSRVRFEEDTRSKADNYFILGKVVNYVDTVGPVSTCKIRKALKDLGLYEKGSGEKFVPLQYKTGSLETRLSIIAGMLDTDGSLSHNGFDWLSKSETMAKDMCFMLRSCGLAAYLSEKAVDGSAYWRVSVSGDTDLIPTRVKRKKAAPRKQIKNVLRTGFTIVRECEKEDYYGFTIGGNHRYLLEDFTVTHNSGKTIMGLEMYLRLGQPCLWLTHTVGLAEQVAERLLEFSGEVAGFIGAGKVDIKHFTIGLIPTLCRRDLTEYKDLFGLVLIDEVHHIPAKTFNEVTSSFNAHYRFGLTATPYRDDGLEDLMFLTMGSIVTSISKQYLRDIGMLMTPTVIRRPTNFDFPYNPRVKKFNYKALEKALGADLERNEAISTDVIVEATVQDNICIVLVGTIDHGEELMRLLSEIVPETGLIHSKQKPKVRKEVRDSFGRGELSILIATYKMLAEGFDYKPTNRLFLTAPFKSRTLIEQACGRIERISEGKGDALVYDYVDSNLRVLRDQSEVRLDVYEASNNNVVTMKI